MVRTKWFNQVAYKQSEKMTSTWVRVNLEGFNLGPREGDGGLRGVGDHEVGDGLVKGEGEGLRALATRRLVPGEHLGAKSQM